MVEEFNPAEFRQQMAQKAMQIPAPIDAPHHPLTLQQLQPQPYAPPAGLTPQSKHAAGPSSQHHVPQQHAAQPYTRQPKVVPHQGQIQAPAQQAQPAPPQQFQPTHQQQFQPQLQQHYIPQSQMPEHVRQGQMGTTLKAVPTASGIARPIIFMAGLAMGVLGMTLGKMLFSGGDTPPLNAISTVPELTSEMQMSEGMLGDKTSMMALTDEMLLDK